MKLVTRITRKFYFRQIMACWLACYMLLGLPVQVALANPSPTPGTLPSGILPGTSGGVVTDYSGFTLNVNSNPGQTVINWANFDIGNGATVNFNQGGGWVLNQVYPIDNSATGIMGRLNANNCGVIVTNPRGIVFGPTAFIDAQSFIASSLRMDVSKFLSGQFEFNSLLGLGNGVTVVDIGAQLHADENIVLLGKKILNMGTVSAGPGGAVIMAAGDKVLIGKNSGEIYVQPTICGDPENHVIDNGGFNGTGPGTIDAPGADVILAAGDIWSTAIEGVSSLRAESHTGIHLNGNVSATGDIDLFADSVHDGWGDMIAADGASIISGADIEIRGNDIVLGGPVSAGGDLTIVGRDCPPPGPDPVEWGNVWAKDTLTAGGNIEISVTAEASEWIDGYWEGGWWVPGHWEGRCWNKHWVPGHWEGRTHVPGYWIHDYYPGTITLDGDVTAIAGHIKLFNDTYTRNVTGNGVTLKAGTNIELLNSCNPYENCTFLQGQHYLGLIAGNEIIAPLNTEISVLGSTLLMQQNPTLNTASYLFGNQANTHLTLISDSGSIISTSGANAANKWKSIGAHANQNITLARSNGKKEITLGNSGTAGKSLWAENGYIDIDGFNVKNSADFADWNLEAGTSLSISVVHGIDLGGDVTSHSGNMELLADTDYQWGHDVVVAGNIDSGGTLDIEGSNVDIQNAQSDGDMDIYAHGLFKNSSHHDGRASDLRDAGDVRVHGTLSTTDGHIQIEATEFSGPGVTHGPGFDGGNPLYNATGTIYLEDNVTANGSDSGDDVRLLSNTVANNNIKIKAHDDVYLKNDKTLTGLGDLYVEAGDDIKLGAYSESNAGAGGSGGEVTTAGDLKMTAGDDVYAYGKLMTKGTAGTIGAGDLTVEAKDDISLFAVATSADAAGKLTLIADSDDNFNGDLYAAGDLYGNMTLSGYNVTVDGKVDSAGTLDVDADEDVTLKKNVESEGDMMIIAGDDITLNQNGGKTESINGNITLKAGPKASDVAAISTGTLKALNGKVKATGETITVNGNINADSVKLTTVDDFSPGGVNSDIYVIGNIKAAQQINVQSEDSVKVDGSITSDNSFIKILANTDNLRAGSIEVGGKVTTSNPADGDIAIKILPNNTTNPAGADGDIKLHGNVDSAGKLTVIAQQGDVLADKKLESQDAMLLKSVDGSVIVDGKVDSGSTLTARAGENIELKGNVESDDDMTMNAGNDIKLNKTSNGYTQSGGKMRIIAGETNSSGDVKAWGKLKTTNAANGNMTVKAPDNISLYKSPVSADAAGTLTLIADSDDSSDGDLVVDGSLYGNMTLSGYFVTVSGNVDSSGTLDVDAGRDIRLKRNVESDSDMTMRAGDDIRLNQNSGNTTSGGKMMLLAGLDDTGGDVEVWGKLQTTDAANGNMIVKATDDIKLYNTPTSADVAGELKLIANSDDNSDGDLFAAGDLYGNMTLSGYSVTVNGNVVSAGNLKVDADRDITLKKNVKSVGNMTMTAGDDITLNQNDGMTKSTNGNITLTAGPDDTSITSTGTAIITTKTIKALNGKVKAVGEQIKVNGNIKADSVKLVTIDDFKPGGVHSDIHVTGNIEAAQQIDIQSGDSVKVDGSITSNNSSIKVLANTDELSWGGIEIGKNVKTNDTADGDITLKVLPNAGHPAGVAPGNIKVSGKIDSAKKLTVESQQGVILLEGNVTAKKNILLKAAGDNKNNNTTAFDIHVKGEMKTTDGGNITVLVRDVESSGYQNSKDDVRFDKKVSSDGKLTVRTGDDVFAYGKLRSKGDMTIKAGDDIYLYKTGLSAVSGGDMTILADRDPGNTPPKGDVEVHGSLISGGSITIDASDNTIYLGGDVTAADYVWLKANTEFTGWYDQHVEAGTWIQADGYLNKLNCGSNGSLYLHANGDISLADYVRAACCCPVTCASRGGGVSIISDNGAIFTPGKYVDGKRALAVDITGRSDQFGGCGGIGVDLPYGPGKAAIVLKSAETLVLHKYSDLLACGTYYAQDVDDRMGVGFLAEPANIGGYDRDQGNAFDAAIYVGSTDGDVHLGGEVDIRSQLCGDGEIRESSYNSDEWGGDEWGCINRGAMIADAYDTVTFGDKFESSLADGRVGDRLEVCSRITEWKQDAVGRLPYVYGGGPFPAGYDYVLRGAGLENGAITDGRAWVLEDNDNPVPAIHHEAGEPLDKQAFEEGGCPVLMNWFASEVGVPADQINVILGNADYLATDIQPCEACARLKQQADAMAALNPDQVNAWASAVRSALVGPPTPEMIVGIRTALADNPAALGFDDAAAEYVRIMNEELGLSTDDALAVLTGNYAPDHADLAAYIGARTGM